MASKTDNGLAKTLAAMDRARRAPREAVRPALIKAGHNLADAIELLAQRSRDTGALIDSISVTLPGRATPPYSQPGGSHVAGETEVIVTVGDADVRYAHLVEYGTVDTEAQEFFWPAFRLTRDQNERALTRAAKKAVKDAWKKQ